MINIKFLLANQIHCRAISCDKKARDQVSDILSMFAVKTWLGLCNLPKKISRMILALERLRDDLKQDLY